LQPLHPGARAASFFGLVNVVFLVLLGLAWAVIECFIGGTRLLYSLPAYGLISVAALLTVASVRRKQISPDAFCIVATLILGGWVLYRAWCSPVPYLAWPDLFMMTGCLMTYLMTALYLNRTRGQTAMIVVLWCIAAVQIWVGVIQFTANPRFMLFGFIRQPGGRASGMYISPNNYAGFLVTVAVLSVSMGIWSRWKLWARVLALYIAVCCMLGVAISGSRGGYFATIGSLLSFVIGTLYLIRIAQPRRFLWVALGSIGGLLAVISLAAYLMHSSDFLTSRMNMMLAKDVRIYNWEAALDHIRVSPWVGTGAGTHLIYGRLFRRPEIQVDPVHAHCDYLELVAEYGFVGGGCMALFIAAHVWRALRTYSEILRRRFIPSGYYRSNSFAIQFGALCAVGGLAIHSVVDFDMHIPANALIFAFLFGVIANPGLEGEPQFASRIVTPLAKAILPLLGVLMLWRALPLLPSEYWSEQARTALRDEHFLDAIAYAKRGLQTPGETQTPAPVDGAPAPTLFDKITNKAGGDPQNFDLYLYIGEANRGLGQRMMNPFMKRMYLNRAVAAFDAGMKVFPQDESLLIRYGQALDGLRKYSDAEVIYQKTLGLDPNLDLVRAYYEKHLVLEGKKAEADALEQARIKAGWKQVDPEQGAEMVLQ
jgi:O-antigen ligase